MTLAVNGTARGRGGLRKPSVVVIGAGMSGVAMGVKLKEAGIDDFVILEKGQSIGGTWRENTYPGLTCDVPSHWYQYTFAKNPEWSHLFPTQPEIERYLDETADRFGVTPRIRFGEAVTGAVFADGRWEVTTAKGVYSADFLVSASGVLHHPKIAPIPGLDSFGGALFHSAQWDHSVPLEGKRVGVVGTGSTGVQIVSALSKRNVDVTLFQRTAQWVAPLPNPPTGPALRWALRTFPVLNEVFYRAIRVGFGGLFQATLHPEGLRYKLVDAFCKLHLRTVRDKALRAKLTPPDKPMCKRTIVHPTFYQAVQRPNVHVVTDSIDRIVEGGILTKDGQLHELDVIVMATGFDFHAFVRPAEIVGEGGQSLDEAWADTGPRAYRTVAVPGFPNFFFIMGPHSPVGNFSLVGIAEAQANYIMRWIDRWRTGQFDSAQPRKDVTEAYNAEIKEAVKGTIWVSGCNSWYLGKDGVPELWPWSPWAHERMLAKLAEDEFVLTKAAP
ncbi:flavin-containing monooxygenase [Segniliparus rugosus]|uniref:Monooxygenase n=1 Tax=Segniliparus rugosus (strain ATCC BAA-974 / DSM 45345 / CCUG 50838 / CIP 108380 / JCM 13579 / CDC 945) TaxID=679197 RepID=E5XST4_SEGRC|nr:NAD(P)/FAD-dependent oxidoreductase [Segniliparus rugosus]EFV12611.1 hypothetical protein HMPREF9336_02556 [Segniliparus rugosus ATCC BAA-974]